jgi:3-methyladenine DNA glycosylase AlkD
MARRTSHVAPRTSHVAPRTSHVGPGTSPVDEALAWLKRHGTAHDRDLMARFGIVAPNAFGVSMAKIQQLARQLGRNHELALALWDTGWYEARMLCSFVDEIDQVTPAQMDRWTKEFDNWGITDTICFNLFDRTPHAWKKVHAWSGRRDEFVKRAAFATLAGLSLHDKKSGDEPFLRALGLVEPAAVDDRNFVKKGVSWALRVVGRRNQRLNTEAVAISRRLVAADAPAARWIGRESLRELTSAPVQARLAQKSSKAAGRG